MSEDIQRQILEEMRRSKRLGILAVAVALIFLVVAIIGRVTWENRRSQARVTPDTWSDVTTAMKQNQFDKAIGIGERLIAKAPNDSYGYAYLAGAYLAKGDLANAEKYFTRAYELWPCEENEKNLKILRVRREREAGKAGSIPK